MFQAEDVRAVGYSYSWSFLLGLLSFLGCEVSTVIEHYHHHHHPGQVAALLCFTAFREQFSCQTDFLMIIPGMER